MFWVPSNSTDYLHLKIVYFFLQNYVITHKTLELDTHQLSFCRDQIKLTKNEENQAFAPSPRVMQRIPSIKNIRKMTKSVLVIAFTIRSSVGTVAVNPNQKGQMLLYCLESS